MQIEKVQLIGFIKISFIGFRLIRLREINFIADPCVISTQLLIARQIA